MAFTALFNPTMMLINPLCFQHLENPREQFGLLRAWGSFGWMVPSLPIYLWLAWRGGGDLTFVLILGIALCLVMAGMSLWLPHTPPGAVHGAGQPSAGVPRLIYGPALKKLLSNANYMVILLAFFLISASFCLYVFYAPLHLEASGLDRAWIGPVQCVGVIVEIILFRWRSFFLHRHRYSITIAIGALALVLRHLVFAYVDILWLLVASYLLVGVVIVFFHIGASLLVNAIAGPEVRSTAQTLLVLCGSGLGPVFSNLVVGYLTRDAGKDLHTVFLFAALLAALAALLILSRGRKLDAGHS
jgi:predicted MFS family arabinose efflux permease